MQVHGNAHIDDLLPWRFVLAIDRSQSAAAATEHDSSTHWWKRQMNLFAGSIFMATAIMRECMFFLPHVLWRRCMRVGQTWWSLPRRGCSLLPLSLSQPARVRMCAHVSVFLSMGVRACVDSCASCALSCLFSDLIPESFELWEDQHGGQVAGTNSSCSSPACNDGSGSGYPVPALLVLVGFLLILGVEHLVEAVLAKTTHTMMVPSHALAGLIEDAAEDDMMAGQLGHRSSQVSTLFFFFWGGGGATFGREVC